MSLKDSGSKLLALAVLLAATAAPVAAQDAGIPPTWPDLGQAPTAEGTHGMVATSSPIASDVGRDILAAGGNAIDAAVAVGFALEVVHPAAGNIGGGGFMVFRSSRGKVYTLDYRETAPAAASRNMYLDSTGHLTNKSIYGALSAGVPGSVAGMLEAHRRFGRLPLARDMAPAIALARDGYIIDSAHSRAIAREARTFTQYSPAAVAFYLVDGKAPAPGARVVQPDLAHTLEAIRDKGRDGFYKGWVAEGDRRRDAQRRRDHHREGPGGVSRPLARADRDRLPGVHHLLDGAAVVGRSDAGDDPQHHGRLRAAAAVRIGGAAAP